MVVAGPLRQVLAAFEGGAASLAEVQRVTGLTPDVLDASVAHLVRLGRLEARELSLGCPSSGCGGCASATVEGTPACGSAGPSPTRRGPALVALTLRRGGA